MGAHLANAAVSGECEVTYWRDRNREVDFVIRSRERLVALEVKSGRRRDSLPGMPAFVDAYSPLRTLLVGGDGVPIEEFLSRPVSHWTR